jgi:hypothetical protein
VHRDQPHHEPAAPELRHLFRFFFMVQLIGTVMRTVRM